MEGVCQDGSGFACRRQSTRGLPDTKQKTAENDDDEDEKDF
jgi:hypothetical protein